MSNSLSSNGVNRSAPLWSLADVARDIEEAKWRLPLPKVMAELGYGDSAKKSARCPFHDDKKPSFGIKQDGSGRWFWNCFTGCGSGDEISFIAKVKNISNNEATKEFLRMAGVTGKSNTPTSAPKQAQEQSIKQLSTVEMLPIEYIDKPLFQANAFHLLVGKKNSGKGTFLSSVAARFTRGELGEARNVIWIAAGEDSLSLDVRPRIEGAKGDTDRVYCPEFIPRLPVHIPVLRKWIDEIGQVGLVVLDPISGMLTSGTNTNLDSDVRETLAPLNDLADAAKCLIIGVRHLRKDTSQGALDSILGTTDWANVPRAVLAIVMDNEDEDVRHVQVVAGNRIPRGTASRSFRIVGAHLVKGGEPVAKAEFIDGPGKDVNEMLQSDSTAVSSKTKLAKLSILDKLERVDDSIESDSLTASVASEHGIADKTVQNAKTWLKSNGLIVFFPDKDEAGKILQWNVKRTNAPRPPDLKKLLPGGDYPSRVPSMEKTSSLLQKTRDVEGTGGKWAATSRHIPTSRRPEQVGNWVAAGTPNDAVEAEEEEDVPF
jgi:AAA domain/CHC2 zinc finger